MVTRAPTRTQVSMNRQESLLQSYHSAALIKAKHLMVLYQVQYEHAAQTRLVSPLRIPIKVVPARFCAQPDYELCGFLASLDRDDLIRLVPLKCGLTRVGCRRDDDFAAVAEPPEFLADTGWLLICRHDGQSIAADRFSSEFFVSRGRSSGSFNPDQPTSWKMLSTLADNDRNGSPEGSHHLLPLGSGGRAVAELYDGDVIISKMGAFVFGRLNLELARS